jgi:hypothetical protein
MRHHQKPEATCEQELNAIRDSLDIKMEKQSYIKNKIHAYGIKNLLPKENTF